MTNGTDGQHPGKQDATKHLRGVSTIHQKKNDFLNLKAVSRHQMILGQNLLCSVPFSQQGEDTVRESPEEAFKGFFPFNAGKL